MPSVPRGKILNIPCERAAQCACAGTYRVCIALASIPGAGVEASIAPTQWAQQIFENDH